MTTENPFIIVSLYCIGVDLEPNDVTSNLDINPTRQQKKGDKYTNKITKKEHIKKNGSWVLSIDSKSKNFSDHISKLLYLLDGKWEIIKNLKNVDDKFIDIFIAISLDNDNDGGFDFEIGSEDLSKIAKLGISVRCTYTISGNT